LAQLPSQLRQLLALSLEAADVQARHGSRKSGLPTSNPKRNPKAPRVSNTPSPQGDLFA
jgi:hypothetical protein